MMMSTVPYQKLLSKANKNPMSGNRLMSLCTEIFKTINNLNPPYMENIFQLQSNDRPVRAQNMRNLK